MTSFLLINTIIIIYPATEKLDQWKTKLSIVAFWSAIAHPNSMQSCDIFCGDSSIVDYVSYI